jgi:endonuclease/exonuclease/phosphatase (EEP) superfamily protein YafD
MTPMRLSAEHAVHVYNLHVEAGWSRADDDARAVAIDQLIAFIDQHSHGEAVIVGGDFNLRDPKLAKSTLAKLRERAGLRDACADCERPHHVDKLLYRGGTLVQLDAETWRLESSVFRSQRGEPLSDHTPVSARFRWSKRAIPSAIEAPL